MSHSSATCAQCQQDLQLYGETYFHSGTGQHYNVLTLRRVVCLPDNLPIPRPDPGWENPGEYEAGYPLSINKFIIQMLVLAIFIFGFAAFMSWAVG